MALSAALSRRFALTLRKVLPRAARALAFFSSAPCSGAPSALAPFQEPTAESISSLRVMSRSRASSAAAWRLGSFRNASAPTMRPVFAAWLVNSWALKPVAVASCLWTELATEEVFESKAASPKSATFLPIFDAVVEPVANCARSIMASPGRDTPFCIGVPTAGLLAARLARKASICALASSSLSGVVRGLIEPLAVSDGRTTEFAKSPAETAGFWLRVRRPSSSACIWLI